MQRTLFYTLLLYLSLAPFQGAHAYIDPGTGSYLFQVFIAFVLGALLTLKVHWIKIKSLFGKFFKKKNDEGDKTF